MGIKKVVDLFRGHRFFFCGLVALSAGLLGGGKLRAQTAVRFREAFPLDYEYHVSTRVDLSGSLSPAVDKDKPAVPLAVRGDSAIEYDERVLAIDGSKVQKTARFYRRIDFQRTVGGRPQQATIRPAVRRLILLRKGNTEVPFSPDGPLMWGEIDQVRTDVFTPALCGLLAEREVSPGATWTAATEAVKELTDMEQIVEGRVECRFDSAFELEKRRFARIAFAGTVRGTNEDGPNRQTLDGYLYFDLQSNHISYVYLKGISTLLDRENREVGRVEGRFVLTRRVNTRCAELSQEAFAGLTLEPNADNTQLLYDNPDLGLRFEHPRRWRVAAVRGNQVTLDSADGHGILLTAEPPGRVPTGAQFLNESRTWLLGQKARILKVEPVQVVRESPLLEHFSLEVEITDQRVLLDYYVARQTGGGATIAARLLPSERVVVQLEIERLSRSVALGRKADGK